MAETMNRYAICHINDIPSRRARGFVLARRHADGQVRNWLIFVIRWGKHVMGYENCCPHEGGNLDWERDQFLDGEGIRIQCGKHGALFDLGTGECVSGPCLGQRLIPISLMIDADGDICVSGVTLEEEEDGHDSAGAASSPA